MADIAPLRGRVELDVTSWRSGVQQVKAEAPAAAGAIEQVEKAAEEANREISETATVTPRATAATTQLGEAARKATTESRALTGGTRDVAAAIRAEAEEAHRAASATRRLADEKVIATTGSRRMGSTIQNAAFQVGDFAVQVSSGTDAMRAFSQQAPQLLGGFGPWGAVIGAATAILSGLTIGLFSTRDAAREAGREVQTLLERWQAYDRIRMPATESAQAMRRQAEDIQEDVAIGALPASEQAGARRSADQRRRLRSIEDDERAARRRAIDEAEEQIAELRKELAVAQDAGDLEAAGIAGNKIAGVERVRDNSLAEIQRAAAELKNAERARQQAERVAAQQSELDEQARTAASGDRSLGALLGGAMQAAQAQAQVLADGARRAAMIRRQTEAEEALAAGRRLDAELLSIDAKYEAQIERAKTRDEKEALAEKQASERRLAILEDEQRRAEAIAREARKPWWRRESVQGQEGSDTLPGFGPPSAIRDAADDVRSLAPPPPGEGAARAATFAGSSGDTAKIAASLADLQVQVKTLNAAFGLRSGEAIEHLREINEKTLPLQQEDF